MIRALIISLAAGATLVAAITESWPQGSMAPEVKIIRVRPSGVDRLAAQRRADQRAADKAAHKADIEAARETVARMKKADEEYRKKIEKGRREAAKKRIR